MMTTRASEKNSKFANVFSYGLGFSTQTSVLFMAYLARVTLSSPG